MKSKFQFLSILYEIGNVFRITGDARDLSNKLFEINTYFMSN